MDLGLKGRRASFDTDLMGTVRAREAALPRLRVNVVSPGPV